MSESNWDFGELDEIFKGKEAPKKVAQKADPRENWISPDEWFWRAADRMLDANRKGRSLKAITSYRRDKDLQSHLQERSRTREREARKLQEN